MPGFMLTCARHGRCITLPLAAEPGYSFINEDGDIQALLAAFNVFDRVLTEGIAEVEGQCAAMLSILALPSVCTLPCPTSGYHDNHVNSDRGKTNTVINVRFEHAVACCPLLAALFPLPCCPLPSALCSLPAAPCSLLLWPLC